MQSTTDGTLLLLLLLCNSCWRAPYLVWHTYKLVLDWSSGYPLGTEKHTVTLHEACVLPCGRRV